MHTDTWCNCILIISRVPLLYDDEYNDDDDDYYYLLFMPYQI